MDKEPKEESPVPHDIEIPIHSGHPLNSIARNAMAIGVLLELWKVEDGGSVMLGDVMREAILTIGKYYATLNDAKLGAAVREALEDVGPLPESLSDAPQGDAWVSIPAGHLAVLRAIEERLEEEAEELRKEDEE